MHAALSVCTRLGTVALVAACAPHGALPADPPVAARPLEDTPWILLDLRGRAARPVGTSTPTLTLDAAQKRASGNGGCNRYGGPYELSGESLRFGPLASTRRACADDALTAQETAFLRALQETRSWRVTGDTLALGGSAGTLARLVARPPS
jgi:heat shock protein HslJ